MKRSLVVIAMIGIAAAAFALAYAHRAGVARALGRVAGGEPAQIAIGRPFPPVNLVTPDSKPVDFAPERGRVTFVNVFATWCPPCRAETPDLVRFAADAAKHGIAVIGIDRAESARQVDAFRRQYGIKYPYLIDSGRDTKTVLGARAMPTTIVVDAGGIVRADVTGPLQYDALERLAAAASH
ncbi:MAG TPA: TlpA disulfide reductase family protein [Candidatus Eremiobacteraceae bacterium]|nr:TlpA disulfide reductase family protein [Candidatus Eremiobacteraceae bacterium]